MSENRSLFSKIKLSFAIPLACLERVASNDISGRRVFHQIAGDIYVPEEKKMQIGDYENEELQMWRNAIFRNIFFCVIVKCQVL